MTTSGEPRKQVNLSSYRPLLPKPHTPKRASDGRSIITKHSKPSIQIGRHKLSLKMRSDSPKIQKHTINVSPSSVMTMKRPAVDAYGPLPTMPSSIASSMANTVPGSMASSMASSMANTIPGTIPGSMTSSMSSSMTSAKFTPSPVSQKTETQHLRCVKPASLSIKLSAEKPSSPVLLTPPLSLEPTLLSLGSASSTINIISPADLTTTTNPSSIPDLDPLPPTNLTDGVVDLSEALELWTANGNLDEPTESQELDRLSTYYVNKHNSTSTTSLPDFDFAKDDAEFDNYFMQPTEIV